MMLKDEIRQEDLEILGVSFLRFDALLVVNKVESAVKEIERWILEYEERNEVNEFVKRKRLEMDNPGSGKGVTHPCPSREGMLITALALRRYLE